MNIKNLVGPLKDLEYKTTDEAKNLTRRSKRPRNIDHGPTNNCSVYER